ncbi:MAG: hypothetical protein AB7V50_05650, partial [Vampirovibrionia bacterium]
MLSFNGTKSFYNDQPKIKTSYKQDIASLNHLQTYMDEENSPYMVERAIFPAGRTFGLIFVNKNDEKDRVTFRIGDGMVSINSEKEGCVTEIKVPENILMKQAKKKLVLAHSNLY